VGTIDEATVSSSVTGLSQPSPSLLSNGKKSDTEEEKDWDEGNGMAVQEPMDDLSDGYATQEDYPSDDFVGSFANLHDAAASDFLTSDEPSVSVSTPQCVLLLSQGCASELQGLTHCRTQACTSIACRSSKRHRCRYIANAVSSLTFLFCVRYLGPDSGFVQSPT